VADIPTVTLADIEAAREALTGVSITTPMEESRWLTDLTHGPVSLKCENLQRTGSFKIRGAYLRMSRLSPEERAAGVVAASAGNHAQGVALAAQMLGIKATVFMPEGAPIPKEKATRGYGADVVFHGRYLEDSLVAARAFAEETGAVLIHPFDHVDIVAGQGTLGLEVLEQVPDVRTVLVPTGGSWIARVARTRLLPAPPLLPLAMFCALSVPFGFVRLRSPCFGLVRPRSVLSGCDLFRSGPFRPSP
jgi:threonine dehydratase